MQHSDDEEKGGEGKGGREGKVRFKYKDAASLGPRDDMLPAEEIKRLLIVHKDLHKDRVQKQKLTRKERKAIKEGKITQGLGQQLGGMGRSAYLARPGLSDKAQFSGIDDKVNPLANNFNDNINLEMQEKLENKHQLRPGPKLGYTSPKPRPRGG